jgi:endonuclease YncB( thermonuclease family)
VLSIIDVHDGDSGWVNLDLGFQISRRVCYRLDGLDAPEVTGPQKAVGLAVRDVVEAWLKRAVICESKSLDKYGRALVVFYDKDGVSLNDLLLKSKMALAYKGESKSAMWSQAELRDAMAAVKTATTPLRP